MPIELLFQGGPRAGEKVRFDDDRERLVLGRDRDRCDVVFAHDDTQVGREHCALVRVLGRYRLVLNEENAVFVDGARARDDDELPRRAEIRLGPKGPVLRVDTAPGAPNLPETVDQGRAQDTMDVAAGARGRANRAALAGVLGVVGVVGVGIVAWQMSQRVEVIEAEVFQLSLDQQRTMVKVQKAASNADVQAAVQAARPSVYMVIERDELGHENAQATAWVVDRARGLLATNTHVARLFTGLKPGRSLVVRSAAEEPVTLQVAQAYEHPGFQAMLDLLVKFDPVKEGAGGRLEELTGIALGGDVGLLQVSEPERLAPDLKLAASDRVRGLQAGEPVGYVGFPGENLAGANPERPSSTTQLCAVTGVTDFFLSTREADYAQLVQHSCGSTGGASGSPILDRNGEVVAVLSGGNMMMVVTEDLATGKQSTRRAPSAAGVNFAQRVDLLHELLDGSANEAQAARTAAWERQLSEVYTPGQLMRVVESRFSPGRYEEVANIDASLSDTAGVLGKASGSWRVNLPKAGSYRIVAVAEDHADIDMFLLPGNGFGLWLATDLSLDWFPVVDHEVLAPTAVVVSLNGPPGTPFRLRAYRGW